MVSLIAAPTQLKPAHPSYSTLNSRFVLVASCSLTKQIEPPWHQKRNYRPGFLCFTSGRGVETTRCKRFEYEGDWDLETQVLEFMKNSAKPDHFPTRKELIEGGKKDLAEAIVKRGGWMVMGWDLNIDNSEKEKGESLNGAIAKWGLACAGKSQDDDEESRGVSMPGNGLESAEFSSSDADDSHPSASSFGQSIVREEEEDAGIDGILSRLERNRNLSLGLSVETNGRTNSSFSNEKRLHNGSLSDVGAPGMLIADEGMLSSLRRGMDVNRTSNLDGLRNSHSPNAWRTWSYQRAGYSDGNFEAAEINYGQSRTEALLDPSTSEILAVEKDVKSLNSSGKNLSGDQIQSRLKHLEMELSSAICLLKSNTNDLSQKVDSEPLPDDLRDVSDSSEFQQTDIIKAQEKLRSLRSKFAVLEGKTALTISDTYKVVEEKEKKIDSLRKAHQLLRPTCVVWTNPALEVFLAGSYDGWGTQRRMEKLKTGIFFLCLRLYPGRYEIKFIVDGTWMVDPLRPIVNNDGYENNVLLVSE